MKNLDFGCYKKLIFDIETTGLPKRTVENNKTKYIHPAQYSHYENVRIIELGYVVLDWCDNVTLKKNFLIKHDGVNIVNSEIHGITNDMISSEGVSLSTVLDEFYNDILDVKILISHNIEFDFTIVLSELYRSKRQDIIKQLEKKWLYCTMINGTKFFKYSNYVKLIQLYKNFIGKDITQNHRALDDVLLCYDCYIKLKNEIQIFSIMDYSLQKSNNQT